MAQPTLIQYANTTRDSSLGLDIFLSFGNFRVVRYENPIQKSTGMIAVLPKGPYITGERLGDQAAKCLGLAKTLPSVFPQ